MKILGRILLILGLVQFFFTILILTPYLASLKFDPNATFYGFSGSLPVAMVLLSCFWAIVLGTIGGMLMLGNQANIREFVRVRKNVTSIRLSHLRPHYFIGILTFLLGALVVAIGFQPIYTTASAIHVQRWVLMVIAGLSFLSGLSLIIPQIRAVLLRGAYEAGNSTGWFNVIVGMLLILAISVICGWIGFGRGVFVHYFGAGLNPTIGPTIGRIYFGASGVLISGVWVAIVVARARGRLRHRAGAA